MFDALNPTKDISALKPLADELEGKALASLTEDEAAAIDAVISRLVPAIETSFLTKLIPALKENGLDMLDGLTVTTVTTISRKVK